MTTRGIAEPTSAARAQTSSEDESRAQAPQQPVVEEPADEELVARVVARARRGLHLQDRLRALGPGALAGAILAQLALLPGAPNLACGLLAASALAWGLLRARRVVAPSEPAAGAFLDARLGGGAVLAAAAEALSGRHERFRGPLLSEAAARLREAGSAASVPWRLSPAWVLALAATALSPLSLTSAPPPAPPQLGSRSLLDPSLLSSAGGGGPEAPAEGGQEPAEASYGLSESATGPEAEPALELPLDVIAALTRAAGPRPTGGSEGLGGAGGDSERGPEPLLEQASQGGLEGALEGVEELKSAAEAGDRAARVRLERLREALAQASGAGGGAGGEGGAPETGGAAPGASAPSSAGAASLPPALAGALERYFGG